MPTDTAPAPLGQGHISVTDVRPVQEGLARQIQDLRRSVAHLSGLHQTLHGLLVPLPPISTKPAKPKLNWKAPIIDLSKCGLYRTLDRITEVIFHCADAGRSVTLEQIHKWHLQLGWAGFAYNFFIDGAATVWIGRPLNRIGAHCKGHNTRSVGICLAGTNNPKRAWGGPLGFSQDQFQAAVRLTDHLALTLPRFNGLPRQIKGHRDYNPHKTCPDFEVKERIVPMVTAA